MLFLTALRRKRLRKTPFPAEWRHTLEQRVPFYTFLSPDDCRKLGGDISIFLDEKHFEGSGGFRITDEVRVIIAAYACLLILHRDTDYYPDLSSIVIYPDEFVAQLNEVDGAGIVTEGEDIRSGESWQSGALVISWQDVLLGGTEGYEDYNVILHEFAHQLDALDGITAGRRPGLTRALDDAFEALAAAAEKDQPTFLDPYGAESPEEFFAVAVEAFFTIPLDFRDELPELYAELVGYFCQDPAVWPGWN